MHSPGPMDHEFAHLCQRLMGAAQSYGWRGALGDIARFLEGEVAQLLSLARVPAAGEIIVFDRGTDDPQLLQALDGTRMEHGLCSVLRPSGPTNALAVLRKAASFGTAERAWLQLLTPHVRLAAELAEALDPPFLTVQAAASFARLLPIPWLLSDPSGRCVERNAAFDRVLEALHGSFRAGRVSFQDPFLESSWRQALSEAHATAEAQSLLASAASSSSWKVHVVPAPCSGGVGIPTPQCLMLVFCERVANAATQTRTLQSSRPLTKAELEVLASLLLGHTAKVIARARGASVHTVRSQITSILGKTGHHTQKELIASFGGSSFDAPEEDS